jgi:hypothetical protein
MVWVLAIPFCERALGINEILKLWTTHYAKILGMSIARQLIHNLYDGPV